jgi:RimJ/RimL family protein N-acetyltransferase
MAFIAPRQFPIKADGVGIVRTAAPEDAEAIAALVTAGLQVDEYASNHFDEFLNQPNIRSNWIQAQSETLRNLLIVAVAERTVIGVLHFMNYRKHRMAHTGEFSMAVHHGWAKRGIGKALLTALIDWAEDHPQVEKICLSVLSTNTHAVGLYLKHGFVREGVRARQIKISEDSYADELLMGRMVDVPVDGEHAQSHADRQIQEQSIGEFHRQIPSPT